MKPLPLRPLPVPSEPLTDFLGRLANANGRTASELWNVLDKGELSHEQLLSCALNGHSLPRFSGPADPRVNIAVELFGLHAADFTHMRRRWCPICIENAAWLRPIWRLKVATVCDIHRVHLLQACPRCRRPANVQAILHGICECGVRFTQTVVPAARRQLQLARALAASLTHDAVLKLGEIKVTLSAPQLVRMICYTGRLIEGPSLSRPGQVRELEELSVASSLFDGAATLLAAWPSAFWRCLERYVDASREDGSVRRVFGSLYYVLYQDLRDPAFQFWRDAFELFLLEHWRGELCGRHRLFQEETINAHRHQGLTRIARTSGVSEKTLRRMVHQDRIPAHRFTRAPKRKLITIDKAVLAHIIPEAADYLDLRSTARFFGLKRTRLRELVAHGVILADTKPDWGRGNHWHFRRSEVDKFLGEFRQAALAKLPEVATITLKHVLQYWRVTAAELGSLLRELKHGDINFALPREGRLCDITFSENDIRHWLARYRKNTIDWVSVAVAAELLGLKEQVAYELVAKNFLVADVISKRGQTFRRISLPSLHHFQKTYVSLAELAHGTKTSSYALLKQLAAQPVTGPKVDGGRQYFYRRSDLSGDVLPTVDRTVKNYKQPKGS